MASMITEQSKASLFLTHQMDRGGFREEEDTHECWYLMLTTSLDYSKVDLPHRKLIHQKNNVHNIFIILKV